MFTGEELSVHRVASGRAALILSL